jgi:hypothetical protein
MNGPGVTDGPNAFSPAPDTEHHLFPIVHGPGCFWASGEYLLWGVRNEAVPVPLVTTGTTAGMGVLGSPGTTVIAGNSDISFGELNGARFNVGFTGEEHCWAVEFSGFFLETGNSTVAFTSDAGGTPVLARPFVNSFTGKEAVSLVSFPGAFSGNVSVGASTSFGGVEGNLVHTVNTTLGANVDWLVGFRYLSLNEDLEISQSSTLLPGGVLGFNGKSVLAPGVVGVSDLFHTHNEFYGGQFGCQVDFHPGRWLFLILGGKIGFGDSHEYVNTTGYTNLSGTGAPPSGVSGGLLAVKGTIGTESRDAFAVVPEGMVNAGVEITPNFRVFVGYTFLYWDNVARPADQISRTINPATVPSSLSFGSGLGGPNPPTPITHTDFWAQGWNVGIAIRY